MNITSVRDMQHDPKYWLGMKEFIFIYNGEWNDPQIFYKNRYFNLPSIEDYMIDAYLESTNKQEFTLEEVNSFIVKNKEVVAGYLDDWIGKLENDLQRN